MAHTVTPQADAEGNVTGFEMETHHEGYHRGSEADFRQFQDGSVHHVFENVELQDEQAPGLTNQDEYYEALASIHPELAEASAWVAGGGLPQEWAVEFNSAVEQGDYTRVNEMMETMIGLYRESAGEQPQPQAQEEQAEEETEHMTYNDLDDDTRQQVDEVTSELEYNTPQGEEVAAAWEQAVLAGQEAGDETYAAIAAATAAFHAGEVSAQDAIEFVLSNYDIRDVSRVYQLLNG